MQTQHAHFGFQAFGVLALPYFLRKITGVCVIQGFIVIGLRPSYEPLALLRWHTPEPGQKCPCGAWSFKILIGECTAVHFCRGFLDLTLFILLLFSRRPLCLSRQYKSQYNRPRRAPRGRQARRAGRYDHTPRRPAQQ